MASIQFLEANKDRFLDELFELLRIPSVSADSRHKNDVRKAAEYVRSSLEKAGAARTEIFETGGHPIVYGEKIISKSFPTVLVYGHYDVQPPDPLELWDSPPFEPVIKDEKIYARGSSDDKGQMYMHVKAFEALNNSGELKCNVKFMIEGEEEVGSDGLEVFIKEQKSLLSADVILISDTAILSNEDPSITVGLRGLSYVEVEVTGPNRDLHSGTYGGAVANPINVLSKMIASLHDDQGKITIPGFYDKVKTYDGKEREEMAKAPFDENKFKKDLNIEAVWGEEGYTTRERVGIRPTLDVNGIWGGYIGEGAKTVLPSRAHAKISMRLVPDQNNREITSLFEKHFKSIAPDAVKVKVKPLHGGEAAVVPFDSPAYQAASQAFEKSFGKKPVPAFEGGSIPIVALFQKELKVDPILMGFGLDEDSIHSPNEHFGLFNFYKGIETIIYFYQFFSESNQQ